MLVLHGFWRSLATYRVRAALNLKRLAFEERMHDLDRGDQHAPAFRTLNPAGAVPALEGAADRPLTQSLAILEWLEEAHPEPPLLPPDPAGRARVRSLSLLTAADTHPLVVPRVQARLGAKFGADEGARRAWAAHWFAEGLKAYEAQIAPGSARCHGDAVSFADLALASHVAGSERFGVDLGAYPRVAAVQAALMAVPAIADAHPSRQPGAPQA